jgi:redox-sensitive bicupin YhaK (pirin superfamily)
MFSFRSAMERGHTRLDWLDSRHSFSFGDYWDQRHMGFGSLRVINEDIVAPGGGFATHGHRDMEIITYVLSGALAHKDSLGNGSSIYPGEVQRMSAGTGIRHSEFNHSSESPVHFLQIWIMPDRLGLAPSYEQKQFPSAACGQLRLVASSDGRKDSVRLHQDADMFVGRLKEGEKIGHAFSPNRVGWLQFARGEVEVAGRTLRSGDGVGIDKEEHIDITARSGDTEFLLFDMAD